jgi:hypothetical protein
MLRLKPFEEWSDKFRTLSPDVMQRRVEKLTTTDTKAKGLVLRDASALVEHSAGRKGASLTELLELIELYGPEVKSPERDYLLVFTMMIPPYQVLRAMVVHTRIMQQGR